MSYPSRCRNLLQSPQGTVLPLTSPNCWEKRWSQQATRAARGWCMVPCPGSQGQRGSKEAPVNNREATPARPKDGCGTSDRISVPVCNLVCTLDVRLTRRALETLVMGLQVSPVTSEPLGISPVQSPQRRLKCCQDTAPLYGREGQRE